MKCDACGTESDFEAGFIKERKSFRTTRRTLCPTCWTRQRRAFEGWYQVAVLAGGVAGYILLWVHPWSEVGRFLTTLFLVDVFLILSIIPHELGHAIVARLVGWRVFAVVVGIGKQLFKFRMFGILFSFHLLPVAGITQSAPTNSRWLRLKRFLLLLAGPMVNAAIAGVIFWIWSDAWHDFGLMGLPRPARLCLWANLWVVAANLWPYQSKTLNLPSDGKQLLATFSRKKECVEELLVARYALDAMMRRDEFKDSAGAIEWCNKGLALFPHNVALLNMTGVLCLDEANYSRAREIFVQLLSRETKPNGTRYIILNNIAYADALIGTPELLPEADAYSQQAYAGAPWVPAIIGTRGTVLVAMGQPEAGIKMLKESFDKAWAARSKAENACHLAIAHARLDRLEEAGQYLKLARQLEPQCRLIGRADAECHKNGAAFLK
jgi:tetratricopeptide (TPR) repeat protein